MMPEPMKLRTPTAVIGNLIAGHGASLPARPPIAGYSLWIPFDTDAAPKYSLNDIATPTPVVDADGSYLDGSGVLQSAALNTLRVGRFTTGLAKPGAIIEPTRTNVLAWSEQFNQWTVTPSLPAAVTVTPNTHTAPDGTLTADTVTDAPGSSSDEGRVVIGGLTSAANTTYVASVCVTEGTAGSFSIGIWNSTDSVWVARIDFEWTGGVCTVKAEDVGTGKVETFGAGWYRISAIVTSVTAGKTLQMACAPTEIGVNDNGKTTIFWGAQLEPGAGPSSYIYTEAVSRQRDADQLTYASDDLGVGDFTVYGAFCLPFKESDSDDDHFILDSRNGSAVGMHIYHLRLGNTWYMNTNDGGALNLYSVADAALAVAANKWYGFGYSVSATGPTVVGKMRNLTDAGADVSAVKVVGPVAPPSAHGGLDIGKIYSSVADVLTGCIRDVVAYPAAHDAAQIGQVLDWLQSRAA